MTITGRCIGTSLFSFLAIGLMTAGLVLVISGADSQNVEVKHNQKIGLGLTVGGTIVMVGIMCYYMCFGPQKSVIDYEIV